MKKLIYTFSIIAALTVFSANANAQITTISNTSATTRIAPGVMADFLSDLLGAIFGNGSSNSTTTNSGSGSTTGTGSTGSTQLPINNGVWFLMIAGAAIGVVTVYKFKAAKTVAQK